MSISDHLPQFLIIENEAYQSVNPTHKLARDFKNFNRDDFLLDFLAIDFEECLNISDINISFNTCIDRIDKLVNQHLPLRVMSKREMKSRSKP